VIATAVRERGPAPGSAASSPHTARPSREDAILRLQRRAGNRAVGRLIRRNAIARRCACGGVIGPDGECDRCRARRLQRERAREAARPEVPRSVDRALAEGGSPLAAGTRAWAETALGHGFGDVRVHTGPLAERSAAEVDARAYTVGRHIVFGSGAYAPHTTAGRRLLVHELAHTVQQADAPAAGPLTIGPPDDAFEREAERLAAAPGPLSDARVTGRAQRLLQRQRSNHPAGGCATCRSPSVAGTLAHVAAQALFAAEYRRTIIPEIAYENPLDAENGRLDLLRIDMSRYPITVEIGEIKPDNDRGVADGRRDLRFYRAQLSMLFEPPTYLVSELDVAAPAGGPFKDNLSPLCPAQTLSIRKARIGGPPGLYLYSCDPIGGYRAGRPAPCCDPPGPPPVPHRVRQEAEERDPRPIIDVEALAYALAGTGTAAAAIKYGRPLLSAISSVAPEAPGTLLATGGSGGTALLGGGGGAAGAGGAGAVEAGATGAGALEAGGTGVGVAGGGGLVVAGSTAVLGAAALYGSYKLAQYTYTNVVGGFVAIDLDPMLADMRAAVGEIDRAYPAAVDAHLRLPTDPFAPESAAAVAALKQALRPLHNGVYDASRALQRGAQLDAIYARLKAEDLPTQEMESITMMLDRGRYYPSDPTTLGLIAGDMETAAEKLKAIILRLLRARAAIIDEQSHYAMKK